MPPTQPCLVCQQNCPASRVLPQDADASQEQEPPPGLASSIRFVATTLVLAFLAGLLLATALWLMRWRQILLRTRQATILTSLNLLGAVASSARLKDAAVSDLPRVAREKRLATRGAVRAPISNLDRLAGRGVLCAYNRQTDISRQPVLFRCRQGCRDSSRNQQ